MTSNTNIRSSVGLSIQINKLIRPSHVAMGNEMLRGVYSDRIEWAQHDSSVTQTNAWITMFMCIIGPRWISTIQIKTLNGIIE